MERTTLKIEKHAFVFQEIAHSRASSEDQLCHIFHDLGFVLWRKCGEPFG
jgi:hypothetical protein